MARHYIKVPESIRDYLTGGAPENWRDAIVADATDGGRRLTTEPLSANDRGPRIAVHGDQYYFWLGRDHFRADTLFVMRIERARLPRQAVSDYYGRFEPWPGGNPPGLDDVTGLFEQSIEIDMDDAKNEPVAVEPSPLLLSRLEGVSSELVAPFRPHSDPDLVAPAGAIEKFRPFWRRYRLEGRLVLEPRVESMLRGAVTPARIETTEWRELSVQFGINGLNAIVLDSPMAERLYQAIADLTALPLDAYGRAAIWTGLLRGLRAADLRRELHDAAPFLLGMTTGGAEAEGLIESGLLRALHDVAIRDPDAALEEVASAAELAEDPVAHVATWAHALDFGGATVRESEEPPSEAQVSVAVRSAADREVVARWVLRISLPEHDKVPKLAASMDESLTEIRSGMLPTDVTAVVSAVEAIGRLSDRVREELAKLPSAQQVLTLAREASQVIAAADQRLTSAGTDQLLQDYDLGLDDLTTIIRLLAEPEDLVRAPAWLVWPDQNSPYLLNDASIRDLAGLLADPERRHRWQKFLEYARLLGEPLTIRWLRPPVGGESAAEALQEWFEGTRRFLDSLPPEGRAEVLAEPGLSPGVLQDVKREQLDLVGRLSAEAQEFLEREVDARPFSDRLAFVRTLARRVDEFHRSTQLRTTLISPAMLGAWAVHVPEPTQGSGLTIQHNWVGASGTRATLCLVQSDPTTDLGFFDAPMVLEAVDAREVTLRLRWTAKGDWRSAWPVEFPSIEPEQLSVAKYQWRQAVDNGRFQHPFTLRIPVRVSRDPRRRLEVSVSAEDGATGETLIEEPGLRWDALNYEAPPVTVTWSTASNLTDVTEHPIGPQTFAAAILDRLATLSCTAILAPRRFGKTTLVSFLVEALKERQIYAIPPLVCTEFRLGQGIDHGALWRHVSDQLYAEYDTGLPGGWSGMLPPEDAFDAVRRAAFRKKHRAVVLLIDEAQLFFPVGIGSDLGSRLKARLERSWALERADMVPLLVCLVGLPPLVQRAGADLSGLLVPVEARGMTEDELRPLIATKVPGLQTTSALRVELARTAGNLYVLRVLLARLADRVTREERIWASSDDLAEVNRALAHELREGREEAVAAYIRDVLNESDDVNIWSPLPCLPVAAAVSDQRPSATSLPDLLRRVSDRLNEWARAGFADARGRPVYDEATVRRHFDRLVTLGVVTHTGDCPSPFLDAWLAGVARRWTADDSFRGALFSGGQRRIAVPDGAQIIHDAGGTRIRRIDDVHGTLAFRVRTIQDQREREIFVESVALFDDLRRAVNDSEDGAAFIFRLEDVGLSMADPREAVQVYRWVEGESLATKLGALAPELVVDIGTKLGRAVTLLHARGILHRDIQPTNVIIDEGEAASSDLRPVLIDFGFARTVGREMRTRLAGEFAAPEVSADRPEWSRAADVFGLCATLRKLLPSKAGSLGPLLAILERGVARSAVDRPPAEKLTSELQEVARDLSVQAKRDQAWATIRARMGRGAYVPELSSTVNRHRTVLELLESGAYANRSERHRIVADITNQFVESKTKLSLGSLAIRTKSESVGVLYALRVLHAHPQTLLHHSHRAALGAYHAADPERQRKLVLEALEKVGAEMKATDLASVLGVYA